MKVLDCSIRDGGYINNWNYEPAFARDLYLGLSRSGIDFIEIGFRSSPRYFDPGKHGPFRFCEEEFLHTLLGTMDGAPISLMVDFGKVDLADIPPRKDSIVTLYRVAAHKTEIPAAVDLCRQIREKGYRVALNQMGITSYTPSDFDRFLPLFKPEHIDFLYFADSYGSLFPDQVAGFIARLKPTGIPVGFHPHNNLQLAFANALEAERNGVDIVDATVYGMGRGAGNLPLEILLNYLVKNRGRKRFNVTPVLDLIDRYIHQIKQKHPWGYAIEYMLSGIFEVHPNYSLNLLKHHEFEMKQLMRALELVAETRPIGFDEKILTKIIASGFLSARELKSPESGAEIFREFSRKSSVTYLDRHSGKDFLILGNGPSLQAEKEKIDQFIQRFKPIVLGGNYLGGLFVPDYHAFSNRRRFTRYINTVHENSRLLLSCAFEDDFIRAHTNRTFEKIIHLDSPNFPLEIENGIINSNCKTISVLLAALAMAMGARRVFIAGMDGYKNKENFLKNMVHFYGESDEAEEYRFLMDRHDWNEKFLGNISALLEKQGKLGIQIITPTTHDSFFSSVDNFLADPI